MLRRSKSDKLAEKAQSAGALAADLARDKKFRRELLAAMRHGAAARAQTARGSGRLAAVGRIAADDDLRGQVREMSDHLHQAVRRADAKRSHKVRNTLLVAGGATAVAAARSRRDWLKEHVPAAPGGGPRVISETIEVEVPVRVAYDQWTQFEEFPRFMQGVERVEQLDDTRLHWVATIGGKRAEWDAKILEQQPDRQVSWISEDGKANRGTVSFEELGPNRTRIDVSMGYRAEGVREAVGSAAGLDARRLRGDLDAFKRLVEERGAATGAWRGEIHGGEAG